MGECQVKLFIIWLDVVCTLIFEPDQPASPPAGRTPP